MTEAKLSNLVGRRIRLLHTDDPKLNYGESVRIKDQCHTTQTNHSMGQVGQWFKT